MWSPEQKGFLRAALVADQTDGNAIGFFSELFRVAGFAPHIIQVDDLHENAMMPVAVEEAHLVAFVISNQREATRNPGRTWLGALQRIPKRDRKLLLAFEQKDVGVANLLDLDLEPVSYEASDMSQSAGSIGAAITKARDMLHANRARFLPFDLAQGPHVFSSVEKTSIVYPDGHGATEFVYTIAPSPRPITSVKHHFGLNDFVGGIVPPLGELISAGLRNRSREATFAYRVLSDSKTKITPVEIDDESNAKVKVVSFRFSPPVTNDSFTYAWGFSLPRMYQTKEPDSSDFLCRNEFNQLSLSIRFMHKNATSVWLFRSEPQLLLLDPLTMAPETRHFAPARETLCWSEYSWRGLRAKLADRYRIYWEPLGEEEA